MEQTEVVTMADVFAIEGVERTGQEVVSIRHDLIRKFSKQPRIHFSERKILDLSRSIKAIGQILPVIVRVVRDDPAHPFELVDGECRWRACGLIDYPVKAVIGIENVKNWEEQFLASVAANFGRTEHTPMEIAFMISAFRKSERFRGLGATEQIEQLAIVFMGSESWVYQHLSLLNLDSSVQMMLSPALPEEQQINLTIAYSLAKLPVEIQVKLAKRAVKEKLSVNQVNFQARKMMAEAGTESHGTKHTRKPSDDIRMVKTFVSRSRKTLDIFLDPLVLEHLQKGVPGILSGLAKDLKSCAKRINDLAEAILVPGESPAPIHESSPKIREGSLKKKDGGEKVGPKVGAGKAGNGLVEQYEKSGLPTPVGLDREEILFRKKTRNVTADEHCLGGSDSVKTCSDVLSVLGCDYSRRQREFSERRVRDESVYVKYAENSCGSDGEANKEKYFYGPFIVFGRFFKENNVVSDDDYFEKRENIRDVRVRVFYPADIKNYRRVFQKWLLRNQKNGTAK